jgi:acyl-CoA reductase-like NAD-dependent aldehyde dehydrogenase
MMHSYTSGQLSEQNTSCDFTQLIKTLQLLNKTNSTTPLRAIKSYTSEVKDFLSVLKETSSDWIALYESTLGYSKRQAKIDVLKSIQVLENFSESTIFDPKHARPIGLVGIYGTWSSPLYRFIKLVLPALLQENSVLLYCSPEVSEIYAKLSQALKTSSLGGDRIAVLPVTDNDVLDAILEHPSIHSLTGQMHLFESPFYRRRTLSEEKLYSWHFGAHNPVLVMNDASIETLEEPFLQALQCHSRSELRFNRWFVQEKIYPQVLEFITSQLQKIKSEDLGQIRSPTYLEALRLQHNTLSSTKHWLNEKSIFGINVCSDFSNCSPLHQTELLGPNITITRFKNGPEATKFAGTTHFANATSIFTSSQDKFFELAAIQQTVFVFHNSIPDIFDESLVSGNYHCSLVTAQDVYSTKRIILS